MRATLCRDSSVAPTLKVAKDLGTFLALAGRESRSAHTPSPDSPTAVALPCAATGGPRSSQHIGIASPMASVMGGASEGSPSSIQASNSDRVAVRCSLTQQLEVQSCLEALRSGGGYALIVDAKNPEVKTFDERHGFCPFLDGPLNLDFTTTSSPQTDCCKNEHDCDSGHVVVSAGLHWLSVSLYASGSRGRKPLPSAGFYWWATTHRLEPAGMDLMQDT